MRTLLRTFFSLLYHQFAFAYDLVAAAVSFGHWRDWIQEVIPFIKGTRILELGHGPGHLQRVLLTLRHGSGQARGFDSVAIDESPAMGGLAKRNSNHAAQLARGLAQALPFADGSFDTIIATFPSEYFVDPRALSEVKRCLSDGGRFVVLPVAMPKNRILSWLFKITKQAPSEARQVVQSKLEEPFIAANFDVRSHVIDLESGTLVIIVAKARGGILDALVVRRRYRRAASARRRREQNNK